MKAISSVTNSHLLHEYTRLKKEIYNLTHPYLGTEDCGPRIRQCLQELFDFNAAKFQELAFTEGDIKRLWVSVEASIMAKNGAVMHNAKRHSKKAAKLKQVLQEKVTLRPPPQPDQKAANMQAVLNQFNIIQAKLDRIMEHLGLEEIPW